MKARVLAAVLLLSLPSWRSAEAQSAGMSYDEFFQLPVESRQTVFRELPATTKGMLLREQASRWREQQRDRLTSDQLAVIDEFIAFSTDTRYGVVTSQIEVDEFKAMGAKFQEHFNREDARNAFTPNGDYIPQQ